MKIENRNIKYPRVELRSGELHFILPKDMDYLPIFQKHENWIIDKKNEINEALKKATKLKLHSRSLQDVKKFVNKLVSNYSSEYGVAVNRIIFRNLTSKWGSCSSQGNLTFNMNLSYLPENHLKYVVFHELIHLIERKHTPKYWSIVSVKFQNYKEIEKELLSYWFLINKKKE